MQTLRNDPLLFQLSGVGVVQTDLATGLLVRVNRTFCEMVGYSETELQRMTLADLIGSEDQARSRESAAALRRGQRREDNLLTRASKKDGSVVWLEFSFTVLAEGEVATSVAIVQDVTARARREAHLGFLAELTRDLPRLSSVEEIVQAVGAKLGSLLELGSVQVWALDEASGEAALQSRWLAAGTSPAPQEVFRLAAFVTGEFRAAARAGETLVVGDTETDPRLDAAAFRATSLRSGIFLPYLSESKWEHTLILAAAQPRAWLEDEIELAQDLAVRLLPRIERARTEAALREAEVRFREVYANNMVPMGMWTRDGRIVSANDAFLGLVGYTRAELEAGEIRWNDLTLPEHRERDARGLAELEAHGVCTPYEKTYRHKDGHHIPILIGGGSFDARAQTGVFYAVDLSEQKRTEAALRESERKFRTLFDSMGEAFYLVEVLFDEAGDAVDLRYLEENTKARENVGKSIRGKRLSEVNPTYNAIWLERLGEVARTGEAQRLERFSPFLRGWFSYHLFRAESGQHQVGVIARDISEQRAAEDALRESEARLQRALAVETVGIFYFNAAGTFTDANEAFLQMSGFTREQIEHKQLTTEDMTLPEWLPRTREALAELRLKGRITPYEKELVRPDGSRWWALLAGARLSADESVEFVLDVTARRQAEEALRELNETLERRVEARTEEVKRSEHRFVQAFNLAPIPATITTLEKETFLEVNEAFLKLTGYSRDEVLGKSVFELGMWSSREDQHRLEQAQQGGLGFRELELHLCNKAGGLHDVLISAEVIALEGAQGYLKMFYDVTERRRTEEQLQLAIQSVINDASWFSREFVSRLNHIRTGASAESYERVDLLPREREILERLAMGWNNKRIAEDMGLKTQTVRNYISNLYDKLGVHSRTEAAVWARERGLIGS